MEFTLQFRLGEFQLLGVFRGWDGEIFQFVKLSWWEESRFVAKQKTPHEG